MFQCKGRGCSLLGALALGWVSSLPLLLLLRHGLWGGSCIAVAGMSGSETDARSRRVPRPHPRLSPLSGHTGFKTSSQGGLVPESPRPSLSSLPAPFRGSWSRGPSISLGCGKATWQTSWGEAGRPRLQAASLARVTELPRPWLRVGRSRARPGLRV